MSSTDSTNGGSNVLEDQLKQASLSSKQEQARLNEEADVVSEKTKRLREQVDELEREEKRLRNNASEACRLHQSLDFEALCLALRRNDAATSEVKQSFFFPTGYAKPLGQALHGNTQVSSLAISLQNLIHDTTLDEPGIREDLKIQVAPLVDYIDETVSLRSVTIVNSHSNEGIENRLAAMFLGAALTNQYVENLSVILDRVPDWPFEYYSHDSKPSSLKTLDIHFSGWGGGDEDDPRGMYTAPERREIGCAFESFMSLTHLELSTTDARLAQAILAGMRRGGCQLQELKLYCPKSHETPDLWTALAALLHNSKQFCHLFLGFFSFDVGNMRALLLCLKRPVDGGRSTSLLTSISELSLLDCDFDRDALRLLVDFMHTRVHPRACDGNDGSQSRVATSVPAPHGTSSLTRLTIDCSYYYRTSTDLSAKTLISMLRLQSDEAGKCYATIGSQIDSLSLNPVLKVFDNFLRLLNKNADRICLSTLILAGMNARHCRDLAKCISNLSSLRTLDISDVDFSARPILASLRANGSIQSATIAGSKSSEATPKLAAAYAERNRLLDGLLLSSSSGRSKDQETSSDSPMPACPTEENYSNSSCSTETTGGMSFSPTLWSATQDIPSTASSKMIRSLLHLCERITDKPAVDES